MSTPKFLRHEKNGRVFQYTPILARRRDMIPVRDGDPEPAPKGKPNQPDSDEGNQGLPAGLTADFIMTVVDKDALVEIGAENGYELKKGNKGVAKLQAELIEALKLA